LISYSEVLAYGSRGESANLLRPHEDVSDTKENDALGDHPFLGYQIQRRTTLWETTLSQGVRYKEEPGGS
jgi:hypothetical protein